jgi:hypothetical protein
MPLRVRQVSEDVSRGLHCSTFSVLYWPMDEKCLVFSLFQKYSSFYISCSVFQPPLWSSGQSSCNTSRRPGFDSRHYQIFWKVVGLKRGAFSLVSATEELLERKSSGSVLEDREYGRGDPLRWPRDILYPQKLALTSPTSGGRSIGIVPSRTKATEFSLVLQCLPSSCQHLTAPSWFPADLRVCLL